MNNLTEDSPRADEALTAGRRRSGGRAAETRPVELAYTTVDSPLGPLLLAATSRGLVRLGLPVDNPDDLLSGLGARVASASIEAPEPFDGARRQLDDTRRQLDDYFRGRRRAFDLAVDWSPHWRGFARRVLDAVWAIPYGTAVTYGDVAAAAGNRRAARAAGNALRSNPVPIVVPCHRVVRGGGGVGGYAGGRDLKVRLLELEGAPHDRYG